MSTGSPERPGPSEPAARPAVRPRRLVAAGLGIVAFGVLLGFLLTSTLRPRLGEDDVITGGVAAPTGGVEPNPAAPAGPGAPAGPQAAPAPPGAQAVPQAPPARRSTDAELDSLARRAEAAPGDVEAQLALVRAAFDAERGDLAVPALDRVLAKAPKHPAALTYLGLLTAAQGRADHGLELIEQALEADPGDAFALWAKGGVLFAHRRDYAGAAATWERLLSSSKVESGTRDAVRGWIAEARWRAEHAREMAGRDRPGGVPGGPGGPEAPAGPAAPQRPLTGSPPPR